ncbi:MAG: alkyl sulfatase C-terminal domain-containing protein, partial [Desulfuromonadales bacterium]
AFVNFFRVRIDPRKSENTDKMVEFIFTDKGDHGVALHVRRGVAEYVPMPAEYYRKPDYVIQLDSETWAALYLSATDLGKTVAAGKAKVVKGEQAKVEALLDLFDKFVPGRNYMVPPLED